MHRVCCDMASRRINRHIATLVATQCLLYHQTRLTPHPSNLIFSIFTPSVKCFPNINHFRFQIHHSKNPPCRSLATRSILGCSTGLSVLTRRYITHNRSFAAPALGPDRGKHNRDTPDRHLSWHSTQHCHPHHWLSRRGLGRSSPAP